ncbi:sarcolemma associated protein [Brevipalpus obovatus]|uniref:sarcolemma associated protein n=1 Tax=Brevipalpus obovatus TaxID=246614 RepID=UPI003D9EE9C1
MNSVPSKEEPAEDSNRTSSVSASHVDNNSTNVIKRSVVNEPLAYLKPKANSHEFQERVVLVNNKVKISRAFGKNVVPRRDNAYFDCKVLSRNHAELFYRNKKFYLQDFKSSNGTYVNNARLSPPNKQSPPQEIFSGDTVQFGIEVWDSHKKAPIRCILATVELYHPDGREALRPKPSLKLEAYEGELSALAACLKLASEREMSIENKLAKVNKMLEQIQSSAESNCHAMIEEDQLLRRIEFLQDKLESILDGVMLHPDADLVCLRDKLMKLHEEKEIYETQAKETFQKILLENLAVGSKNSECEILLNTSENQKNLYKTAFDDLIIEMKRFSKANKKQFKEMQDMKAKYKDVKSLLKFWHELEEGQPTSQIETINKGIHADIDKLLSTQSSSLGLQATASSDTISNPMSESNHLPTEALPSVPQNVSQENGGSKETYPNNSSELLLPESVSTALSNSTSMKDTPNVIANELSESLEIPSEIGAITRFTFHHDFSTSNEEQDDSSEPFFDRTSIQTLRSKMQSFKAAQLSASKHSSAQPSTDTNELQNREENLSEAQFPPQIENETKIVHDSGTLDQDNLSDAYESSDKSSHVVECEKQVTDAKIGKAEETMDTPSICNDNSSLSGDLPTKGSESSEFSLETLIGLQNRYEELRIAHQDCAKLKKEAQSKLDSLQKERDEVLADKFFLKMNLEEVTEIFSQKEKKMMAEIGELNEKYQNALIEINQFKATVKEYQNNNIVNSQVSLNESADSPPFSNHNSLNRSSNHHPSPPSMKNCDVSPEILPKEINHDQLITSIDDIDMARREIPPLSDDEKSLTLISSCLGHEQASNTSIDHVSMISQSNEELQNKSQVKASSEVSTESRAISVASQCTNDEDKVENELQLHEMKRAQEEYKLANSSLESEIKALREELEIITYQNKMASVCAIAPLLILLLAIVFAWYPSLSSFTGTMEGS